MKNIIDFFDGNISKADITSALSRFTILLIAIVCSVLILQSLQGDTKTLDMAMNPLYQIVQDTNITDSARAVALDKLTTLSSERQATSFWQTILHSAILMFFWLIVAAVSGYAFTKWKWTNDYRLDAPGLKEYADIQKEKISFLKALFATVFIAGAIIYLADKL